jgi:hypothetical protein
MDEGDERWKEVLDWVECVLEAEHSEMDRLLLWGRFADSESNRLLRNLCSRWRWSFCTAALRSANSSVYNKIKPSLETTLFKSVSHFLVGHL